MLKSDSISPVVNARSARGLSLSAYILETLSYAITLAYSFRNGFPFSTYGENFFLTIQNAVITLLIISYAPASASSKSSKVATAMIATIASSVALYALPQHTLSLLQLATLPLSLFSKLPQIRQNSRSQSTGQLSAFAVISQIAGCIARLFTTATEIGDSLVAAGFGLALLLNLVLGAQLWMYWGQGDVENKDKEDTYELRNSSYVSPTEREKEIAQPAAYEPAPWQAPQTHRVSTPPPRTSSAGGARKWARKVD